MTTRPTWLSGFGGVTLVLLLPLLGLAQSRAQLREGDPLRELLGLEKRLVELAPRAVAATVGLKIGPAQGSGVIVSKDGLVMTAGHVFERPGEDATVLLSDGRKVRGITLGRQETQDFGMIRLRGKGPWPHLPVGDSTKLERGQIVLALGHPGGYQRSRSAPLRLGRITSLRGEFFRTSCTINSGDSGGPVIDLKGRVIGIHSRIRTDEEANYHIPAERYRKSWKRLLASEDWGREVRRGGFGWGRPRGPSLGLTAEDLPRDQGIRVLSVYENMGAGAAGVKKGDVIITVNDKPTRNLDALQAQLRTKKEGETILLGVKRGEKTLSLGVELRSYRR